MKGRPSIGAIFILGSLWLLACGAMTVTSRDMHITEPMFTASTPSTAPKGRQAQMTAVNDDSPQFQPRMVAADSFTCIVVPLWTAWSSCVPPTPCAFRGLTLRC